MPPASSCLQSSGVMRSASLVDCMSLSRMFTSQWHQHASIGLNDDANYQMLTIRQMPPETAMEVPQHELQASGQTLARSFRRLTVSPWTDDDNTALLVKRRIASGEERFQLWAQSLGLFQKGHASLDYRVGDAPFIKSLLIDLLGELQDHVQNCLYRHLLRRFSANIVSVRYCTGRAIAD